MTAKQRKRASKKANRKMGEQQEQSERLYWEYRGVLTV